MPENNAHVFGDLVRQSRLATGLTQEELAERSGLSVRGISDLERGLVRAPRRDTLALLAEALALPGEERERWDELRRRLAAWSMMARSVNDGQILPDNQLPDPLTSFVGRERDLATVTDLMRRPEIRLLTLTGPGGVGKTRLAIAAGHAVLDDYPDGV